MMVLGIGIFLWVIVIVSLYGLVSFFVKKERKKDEYSKMEKKELQVKYIIFQKKSVLIIATTVIIVTGLLFSGIYFLNEKNKNYISFSAIIFYTAAMLLIFNFFNYWALNNFLIRKEIEKRNF